MEPAVLLFFLVGGIGLAIYLFYSMRSGYRDGYRRGQAEAVTKGAKPWGQPMSHTFGSAYIMTPQQIIDAGLGMAPTTFQKRLKDLTLGFLLLGATQYKKQTANITFEQAGHLLTIAPTRSGKGVSAVIPNLLFYTGSVVVNDIKGENYAVTASWRRKMGHNVHVFAPFVDEEVDMFNSSRWNPFDMLVDSDDPWEDCRYMAELLVPDERGNDDFWSNAARNFLTGLILYIHTQRPEQDRMLVDIRILLTQNEAEFLETLRDMTECGDNNVERAANVMWRADDKVREGILSTLDSHLSFLDSKKLVAYTHDSTMNFKDLKEDLCSIYLILPPERLRTFAPFVRLFMGMAALEMKRIRNKPEQPVLFMIDEFPAMGRMRVVEEEIAYLAGYGINLWLFAQDLKQIASIYGDKAQSIIANCAVKQFFGVSDVETAQLVSMMCGETSIPSISYSSEQGLSIKNGNLTLSSGARPLLTTNEVMSMDKETQLLFFQGQQMVIAGKPNYLTDPLFKDNGQPIYNDNPFFN